jgi:hypothetical protein
VFNCVTDVFWYRDAEKLNSVESDERAHIVASGGNVHELQLFNVTKADEGFYLCIAVSSMGKRTKSFKLNVTGSELFYHSADTAVNVHKNQ